MASNLGPTMGVHGATRYEAVSQSEKVNRKQQGRSQTLAPASDRNTKNGMQLPLVIAADRFQNVKG